MVKDSCNCGFINSPDAAECLLCHIKLFTSTDQRETYALLQPLPLQPVALVVMPPAKRPFDSESHSEEVIPVIDAPKMKKLKRESFDVETLKVENAVEVVEEKRLILFLHGIGNSEVKKNLFSSAFAGFGRVLAPEGPYTAYGGRSTAWFKVSSEKVDIREILTSITELEIELDLQYANGYKPENVLVVGFSQGSTMAMALSMHLATHSLQKQVGALALFNSGTILTLSHFNSYFPESNLTSFLVPMYVTHGSNDKTIPIAEIEVAIETLRKSGCCIQYNRSNNNHGTVDRVQLDEAIAFFNTL